jgi:acetyl-CoA synthetase
LIGKRRLAPEGSLVSSQVEQDYPIWQPTPEVARQTTIAEFLRQHELTDLRDLLRRADAEPDWYWPALLEYFDIRFVRPYSLALDVSKGVEWPRWCVGGTTNVVLNCLDKHRDTPVWQKIAIVWEGEDQSRRSWTYAQLDTEVCRLAGALRSRNIAAGEVVGIYMPMVPEAAAAFLAIAKIGAVAMPLFSGFGPQPIAERLIDAEACAVITVDVGRRRGKSLPMKETLDRALVDAPSVHTVIVAKATKRRLPGHREMSLGRLKTVRSRCRLKSSTRKRR